MVPLVARLERVSKLPWPGRFDFRESAMTVNFHGQGASTYNSRRWASRVCMMLQTTHIINRKVAVLYDD